MISLGVTLALAKLYWLEWYGLAFWLAVFLLLNNVLGTAKALINPDWYAAMAYSAGVEPSYPRLIVMKSIIVSLMMLFGWHVGSLAGYL